MPNITIEGHLLGDPEMRYTQTGKALTKFHMQADNVEQPFDVVAWEDLAELAAYEFAAGSLVKLTGYIKTSAYTHRDEFTIQVIHFDEPEKPEQLTLLGEKE